MPAYAEVRAVYNFIVNCSRKNFYRLWNFIFDGEVMKIFTPVIMLTFLMTGSLVFAKADTIEMYTNAVMTGDIPALENLLAPNYWNIASNGHIRDKEHFIDEIKNKALIVDRLTLTNIRETKVGETRLLTANGVFYGKTANPRPQGLMRYTIVLANNNGKEQVVLFQSTPVVPTKDCEDGNCKIK